MSCSLSNSSVLMLNLKWISIPFLNRRRLIKHCVCKHAQSCLTLCDPMDCIPPSSSGHGILQAGILEWVAKPSSRGSPWTRDGTQVSCIAGRFFTSWAIREALLKGQNGVFYVRICNNEWSRKWQPTPVFLPGESHGQRSLVGYSPRGHKVSDTTEWLHFHSSSLSSLPVLTDSAVGALMKTL